MGGVKVVVERGRKKWKEVSGGRDESVDEGSMYIYG